MEGIENRDMQKQIDKYLEQVFDIIFFFVIKKIYVYFKVFNNM